MFSYYPYNSLHFFPPASSPNKYIFSSRKTLILDLFRQLWLKEISGTPFQNFQQLVEHKKMFVLPRISFLLILFATFYSFFFIFIHFFRSLSASLCSRLAFLLFYFILFFIWL